MFRELYESTKESKGRYLENKRELDRSWNGISFALSRHITESGYHLIWCYPFSVIKAGVQFTLCLRRDGQQGRVRVVVPFSHANEEHVKFLDLGALEHAELITGWGRHKRVCLGPTCSMEA